jgi:hypothetical protein
MLPAVKARQAVLAPGLGDPAGVALDRSPVDARRTSRERNRLAHKDPFTEVDQRRWFRLSVSAAGGRPFPSNGPTSPGGACAR